MPPSRNQGISGSTKPSVSIEHARAVRANDGREFLVERQHEFVVQLAGNHGPVVVGHILRKGHKAGLNVAVEDFQAALVVRAQVTVDAQH